MLRGRILILPKTRVRVRYSSIHSGSLNRFLHYIGGFAFAFPKAALSSGRDEIGEGVFAIEFDESPAGLEVSRLCCQQGYSRPRDRFAVTESIHQE